MRTDNGSLSPSTPPYLADNLAQHAHAVLEAAAIFVGALIAQRREEFVSEIAVGGVNLDDFEAGARRRVRRLDKVGANAIDVLARHLSRRAVIRRERNRRRRDRLPSAIGLGNAGTAFPWALCAGLASGVRQLNSGDAAVTPNEPHDRAPAPRRAARTRCRGPAARCGPRAKPRLPRSSPARRRPQHGCPGERSAIRWRAHRARSTRTWARRRCGWTK